MQYQSASAKRCFQTLSIAETTNQNVLLLSQHLHEALGAKTTEDRHQVNEGGGTMAEGLRKMRSVLMTKKRQMMSKVHAVVVMNRHKSVTEVDHSIFRI